MHGCLCRSVKSKMAVGYELDGSVAPLYDLGWESPAGQMFSTTADLNTVWPADFSLTLLHDVWLI